MQAPSAPITVHLPITPRCPCSSLPPGCKVDLDVLLTCCLHKGDPCTHIVTISTFVVFYADFLANEKGKKREEVKSWTPYPGGAPANVATALTKLGVPTAFVSALGNDERGEELMKLFNGEQQLCMLHCHRGMCGNCSHVL
jgi:hypothetical protein